LSFDAPILARACLTVDNTRLRFKNLIPVNIDAIEATLLAFAQQDTE
jgi:hypothetical protein